MDSSKKHYLDTIRANSAYPTYRGIIGIITMLGNIAAAVIALSAVIGGLGAMSQSFKMGLGVLALGAVFAALIYFLARYFKEAALILADIGDSMTDSHSRGSYPSR